MSDAEAELTSKWQPSERVVESVAEAEGVDPVDLTPPLNDVVDLDALDALFAPVGGVPRAVGRVEFRYDGYVVVVEADGSVTVEPADATSAES
ncbi:HalOD1 output domain-containing protein [Halostella litorea]|uniref:HalOD1 output domain-containing protein n=1 Tax=Halostella litorea TaxID=2528831 RepID=UPI001092A64A|nr:HalOD1 output domain-containing protein [Halostella litorea]